MSTNTSLTTLLRALQSTSNEQETSRLLVSAAHLLTLLSNPANVTLLTSHLLSCPAISSPSPTLSILVKVISTFNSAGHRLLLLEQRPPNGPTVEIAGGLTIDQWTSAIFQGLDGVLPHSKRVLVIAGLLQAIQNRGERETNRALWTKLKTALFKAVNTSLQDVASRVAVMDLGLVVAVGQSFDLLDMHEKNGFDYDSLLPVLLWGVFCSKEGLHQGYFLSTIDPDVTECSGKRFDWSITSPSYLQLQSISNGSMVTDLGRLARLIAFSAGHATRAETLTRMLHDLLEFSRSLAIQWRQNKLSEIDISEEIIFLTQETLTAPLPLLWRTLRSTMYAIVVILTAFMRRLLTDNLGARLDAEAYLREIKVTAHESIPQHPLDRSLDLYFLNTAEHFAVVLDTPAASMLITSAVPYLGVGGDRRLWEVFEAAHAVTLAVLALPHNVDLAASQFESYVEVLFQVFPRTLSPRQFRLAIKQLVRIASPPSLLYEQRPLLSPTLLELLYARIDTASSQALTDPLVNDQRDTKTEIMSEQGVLLLAIIDTLPFLEIEALQDWLPTVGSSINMVLDPTSRQLCKSRLWDILTEGEMDVDRAAYCAMWWNTKGGQQMVLHDRKDANLEPLIEWPTERL
ncbi:MAG: hypothetical protein Q9183_000184 [Haloplaca sp. 2 TL-2023]